MSNKNKLIKNNNCLAGFTLLELMIAVAIIALLAAVSIPAYQKYVQKSKLSEGYIMLRKMFDGAVLESAKIAVQEYDGGVLQECIETRRFGEFASFILISGVENYIPPQNGLKAPIYFKQASKTFGFTKSGDCTVWAENTNLGFFGFSVDNGANDSATVEARHFAYSNRADLNLFMVLMGEGKNVAYNIDNSVSVNSLWAFADLDGDYTTPDPSLGQNITNVGLRSTELTYLSRGIYLDTVTNQVVGTDGVYAENLGE